MKKLELKTGFVPGGYLKYKGEYIYRVISVREGEKGLGENFPQPEWLDLELEGHCGIKGRLEKEKPISINNPLDCSIHQYYNLEHEVWVKNIGGGKYISDWTPEEKWGVAVESEFDENGNRISEKELGFCIIQNDRRNGICI